MPLTVLQRAANSVTPSEIEFRGRPAVETFGSKVSLARLSLLTSASLRESSPLSCGGFVTSATHCRRRSIPSAGVPLIDDSSRGADNRPTVDGPSSSSRLVFDQE